MTAPRRAISALSLAAFVLVIAGPASALVAPEGGQAAYDLPLRAFDLDGYRSAMTDADRAGAEIALTRGYGGTWTVYSWNPQSRSPSEMYGSGADVTGPLANSDNVRAAAEIIIRANPATLKADLSGLRFKEATNAPPVDSSPDGIRRPGKWAAHFQQTYHGIDVVGGEVHLTFLETGRLFALGSTYYQDISVDWTPGISGERAKDIARGALPFHPETDSVEVAVKLLVLPVPLSETQVEHHLIWETRVHTREPLGVWITSVDAQTGRILRRTNDINFIHVLYGTTVGQVERFSHCDGTQQEALPRVFVRVDGIGETYSDANGNWWFYTNFPSARTLYSRLKSPYVDVVNVQGVSAAVYATIYTDVSYQVTFDNSNSRADERDVYQTVQDLHTFFETFAPGFGFTNQQVSAQVNINSTCNAYYLGNAIHFYNAGNGCANTGQMMDVVAHEYGHGVQEAILGWQGDQGLGEGNGDVTGFLMTMSSVIGRGIYNCSSGFRDASNALKYPDDVIGQEIHDAGRVIAGFHWDAMQDQIVRYGDWGRYSAAWDWHWGRVLQLPTTQPAQVLATFIANDDDGNLANGTPQFNSYCLAAANHGFTCPQATLPLGSAGCDTYHQVPQGFQINQTTSYWTAIGVLPSPADDKDLLVFTAGFGSVLAGSFGTQGMDFVVGDFNHNPMGVYQPYVTSGGTTIPYVTEWDSGPDQITPGVDVYGTVGGGSGSCGAIRIWDVYLQAGESHTFSLSNAGGGADMRLSLFQNPAVAPYWVGRSSSVFEVTLDIPHEFTAPTTDWYGVVVFNNSPGAPSGSYVLRVSEPPVPLASAVCQSWNTSPRMFSVAQTNTYWTGVAVNPISYDDKDISVYGDPGGAGAPLASSTGNLTDFVVGDFNHNAPGTYYPRVSYGGASAAYVTEWEGGADVITVGVDVNGSVGGGSGNCGLIQVSDVYLTGGQDYRFYLQSSGGADIRMSLFRNPSNGTYWAGRTAAEFEVGSADGRTYTAPVSDWYGVVVFNNSPDAPAGDYIMHVREAAIALADGVCQTSSPSSQWFSFTQAAPYWSVIAVNPIGTESKALAVYDNPDGLQGLLAFSRWSTGTQFVIGDFNHNAAGTYSAVALFGGVNDYVMDWDTGPPTFPMGTEVSGTVGGGTDTCGLVKVWDVYLEAGTTYQVVLTAAGDADIRVSLFQNWTGPLSNGSATYWGTRNQASVELQPAATPYAYTAPATDYYGLVVFNASPDSRVGEYTIRLDNPASTVREVVETEPGIAFRNPYPAGSPISLRAAADGTAAHVEIFNVQGRMVRAFPGESVGKAGRQIAWDGRADDGARLGAGIYFLRAQIGSERINRTLLLMK